MAMLPPFFMMESGGHWHAKARRGARELSSETGAIAQLGERLPCTQEVRSSILLGSTTNPMVPWRTLHEAL
jgi:hypothetical protein